MHHIPFVQVLRSLNLYEINGLIRFAKLGMFFDCPHKKAVQFAVDWLARFWPFYELEEFDLMLFFSFIFPDKPYDDELMAEVMDNSFKMTATYLALRDYLNEENSLEVNRDYIRALDEKGFFDRPDIHEKDYIKMNDPRLSAQDPRDNFLFKTELNNWIFKEN